MNHSEESVKAVLEAYFDGCYRGDVPALRALFAPHAVMNGYLDGQWLLGSPEPFFSDVASKPPLSSGQQSFDCTIDSLAIVGDIAAAEVTERGFGPYDFRDLFHLVFQEGQWLIVSKTFTTLNHLD